MSLQRKREQDTQTEGDEEEEDRSKWMIPIRIISRRKISVRWGGEMTHE